MDFNQYQLNFARARQASRPGPQIIEGPSGPGLTYDHLVIHSQDDPWREAEDWLEKSPRDRTDREPDLALIFGLGLGYHLKALRDKYPGIRLVVFEPVPEMKNIYDRHTVWNGADGEPPVIITEWREYETAVSRDLVYGRHNGVIVVVPEGYRALKPEAFGAFDHYTRQEIVRRAVIERTRDHTDARFLKHLAENAGFFPEIPDLLFLKGRLPARPAFIVGSGPSLDENAEFLRGVGDKGLILASSSALKPLLAKGVRPDVVLVLESGDTSDYLRLSPGELAVMGPDTVLALSSSCHPAHFMVPGFHRALFHLTAGEAQTFSHGLFLPQGGNSGSAAFALAYAWGLAPLVLVAQDQAYGQGRLHAAGTPGEAHESDPSAITVKGVGDTVVETNTGLLASLTWYAEAAKTIAAQPSPPPLYNASAGGARIPGFSEVPLATMVASLPPVAARLDLAGVLPRLPRSPRAEMRADVAQLAGVVHTLRRMATMDYRKAYEEIKDVDRINKFLGQILAEAKVAASRQDLLAALDKADGLMTVMQTSLADVQA